MKQAPLIAYTIVQVGVATCNSLGALVTLRFITGFLGSPALATGGATLADVFAPMKLPYLFSIWTMAAVFGPALGPSFGGFAAQANGWRWPMWELLWIIGFTSIVLFFFLPETSHANILLRRAERLRKITGNQHLRAQSEIDQGNIAIKQVILLSILRPFEITFKDPAVAFSNFYIMILYSTYYLFVRPRPSLSPYGQTLISNVLQFDCFGIVGFGY